MAQFEQPVRVGHITLPNGHYANSPGSTPTVLLQGRLGISLDIDSAPSILQPELASVSTPESANVHASDLPTHCQRSSNAIRRHTTTQSTQVVGSLPKQVVAWPATNNIVEGSFNSPLNRYRKLQHNPIPPAYLWTLPPFVSLWSMPTRGTKHPVQVLCRHSWLKICIAQTMRHSPRCLWLLHNLGCQHNGIGLALLPCTRREPGRMQQTIAL